MVATETKDVIRSSQTPRTSFIELLRVIFLILLVVAHSGWILAEIGLKDGAFQKFLDSALISQLSYQSTMSFACISGLYIFQKRSFFNKNVSRLFYILIANFVLGCIVVLSTEREITGGTIVHLLTGSRDSWYLYAVLFAYWIAPAIARFFEDKHNAYLVVGLLLGFTWLLPGINIFPFSTDHMSPFWILGLAMVTHWLRGKLMNKKYIAIIMALFSFGLLFTFAWNSAYGLNSDFMHVFGIISAPLNGFFGVSLVVLASYSNWNSKIINWISSRSYFVYEFHWLAQILYVYFFGKYTKDSLHLHFYLSLIFVFGTSFVVSVIFSEIQFRLWNVYMTPKIFSLIDKTKAKFFTKQITN